MKISHSWLQSFFKNPLPETDKIAELFTFHIFEVEDIDRKANDNILDIKVLPDRAGYCLSHEGIARELSSLVEGNVFEERVAHFIESSTGTEAPDIEVKEGKICNTYLGVKIFLDEVMQLPEHIKTRLEAVGQRQINPLVDLANFIMLDMGEPMHVFDASKVDGPIVIRFAKDGESITTLDGKEVKLDPSILIEADNIGPLAIAGIKGGKRAEANTYTKSVIVVAGNFDSSYIRKISSKIGIKTDASKRFENSVSKKQAFFGMRYFLSLIKEYGNDPLISKLTVFGEEDSPHRHIEITKQKIENALGVSFTDRQIIELLSLAHLQAVNEVDKITIAVPHYRNDLNITEDIVDEIGRLYGYEKIEDIVPNIVIDKEIEKGLYYQNRIRDCLSKQGFSEVYTYTLASKGEAEIQNPLASDKGFVRTDLSPKIEEALSKNIYYADLLGLSKIKIFEIGKVFKGGREFMSLTIGIAHKKATKNERPNDEIKIVRDNLFDVLGVKAEILCTVDDTGGLISIGGKTIGVTNNIDGVMEVDLDTLIEGLPQPTEYFHVETNKENKKFIQPSEFPFIARDIAIFVPGAKGKDDEMMKIIKMHGGDNLVRVDIFDIFEKKDKATGVVEKTSYGFRLVFQSKDKTLTSEEVDKVMETITFHMKQRDGLEVR